MEGLTHLGSDIAFEEKQVRVAATGDADGVEGLDCYFQDIVNRLSTPKGAIWCHPEYGVLIYNHLQEQDSVTNRLEMEQDIRRAMEEDPRSEYGTAHAEVIEMENETIKIAASVKPIGHDTPLNLVLKYDQNGAEVL
ncbi:MAG: hypothetical protein JJT76_12830 [Clostridiaceae bacterium]|nr:hypothetical protein [Clostridiaceae bacterium]